MRGGVVSCDQGTASVFDRYLTDACPGHHYRHMKPPNDQSNPPIPKDPPALPVLDGYLIIPPQEAES